MTKVGVTVQHRHQAEPLCSLAQTQTLSSLSEIRQCDSGWKSFDGSCYYIVTTMKNWTEARGFCKSMNSDLVIIKSAREQKFLENITSITKFWIGLTKDRNKNVWRWVDGTLHNLSDGFWYEDEPNNEAGREDCVNLWKDKKWNDVYCTGLYKAICERKLTCCV
uniref:C-type lectin domain-containing protein n=1 Tax=Xenopus tropicalis TaxID=8364 RepID=A0A803KFN4_XENTR